MKTVLLHFGFPMFVIALFLAVNCSGVKPLAKTSESIAYSDGIEQRSVSHLHAELGEETILIDVRTKREYRTGHVPGAKNLPLSQLAARISELDAYRDSKVHLICASGVRSQKAALLLLKNGFKHPINVIEGTRGWISAGHSTD